MKNWHWIVIKIGKIVEINIKGLEWTYDLLPLEQYIPLYGKGDLALCIKDKRKLVFILEEICITTIYHELTHAYMASLCIDSCHSISADDYEEIFCEINGNHIEDIVKQGKEILKNLNKEARKLSKVRGKGGKK